MKTKTTVETEVENITFGFWDKKREIFLPIPEEMEIKEAAKEFKCSPELVESLTMLAENIIENVRDDLKAIWKRLDGLENL